MTWLLRSGARTLRRERWPSRQVSPVKKRGRGASRLWTTWWLHPTGDALLMGLSRGLVVCGVTEEWTTQDLMNAVEADHQGLGLLSLPPDSQKNPGALLLHRIKRAITGKEPPARARRAAETARRETQAAELAQRAAEAKTKTTMPA